MPKLKSLNRKGSPLGTLKYIHNTVHEQEYGTWNMYRDKSDVKGMAKEILNNESERGTRKYYHEIVAFHPKDSKRCTKELLEEFAESYIKNHFPDNKIFWGVHRDKDHPHVHFCISATKLDGTKLNFKKDILEKHNKFVQDFSKEKGLDYLIPLEFKKSSFTKNNLNEIEKQMKNRGQKPDKEVVHSFIEDVLNNKNIRTKSDFDKYASENNMTISKRETGVVFNERTYRFKTLGYDKEFYRNELFYTVSKEISDNLNKPKTNDPEIEKDYDKDFDIEFPGPKLEE